MKYKELERIVTGLSCSIRKIATNIIIEKEGKEYISTIIINENQINEMTIHAKPNQPQDFDMLHAAMQYANTPLEKRQEEN